MLLDMTDSANFINHITIAGDESWSMTDNAQAFIQVYDNLVAHLGTRSKVHGQETRISTFLFNASLGVRCINYDMDVLRVPSIRGLYHPRGGTPLVDAALQAIEDLRLIPQKYGSHAFLTLVLTDGEENSSRNRGSKLAQAITSAPDNETYAVFVPDQMGVSEAKRFGFPAGNISVWDTTRTTGVEEAGATMRAAADTLMEGRSRGIHGYNTRSGGASLFKLRDFSATDVTSSVTPLTEGSYFFLDVSTFDKVRIDEFVTRETRKPYILGRSYYQFMKTETIQPQKNIAVLVGGRVYEGPQARAVLGLPTDHSVRVRPDEKPGCTIFVQSTSYNRNLVPGTRLLVLR